MRSLIVKALFASNANDSNTSFASMKRAEKFRMGVAAVKIALVVIALLSNASAHAKAIKATSVSDLNFGVAVQGDPPKTIPPGTSENTQNASFEITGDSNRAYTVVLPSGAVSIQIGRRPQPNEILQISNFQSYPSGSSGLLNVNGVQMLYVGATRSAVGWSQAPGSYDGSFTVTVVY